MVSLFPSTFVPVLSTKYPSLFRPSRGSFVRLFRGAVVGSHRPGTGTLGPFVDPVLSTS